MWCFAIRVKMGRFIDVISLIENVYNTSHNDRDLAGRFDEISPRKQNAVIFSFLKELSFWVRNRHKLGT